MLGSAVNGVDWYLTGNLFHDSGWRDASPSDVRQIFAKLGWRNGRTDAHVTGAYADNTLTGNALQEQRLIATDYSSVYTTPDITTTGRRSSTPRLRHSLTSQVALSVNGYFRNIRTSTLNGDVNEDSLDQSVYQPSAADIRALTAAGYTGFPDHRRHGGEHAVSLLALHRAGAAAGRARRKMQRPAQSHEQHAGQLRRLRADERARARAAAASNRFTAGGAFDRSTVGFVQTSQLGYLNPDRSVTGVAGAFADGVSGGNVDGAPFDNRVDLDGEVRTASVYATDTISVNGIWHLTLAGRFNQTAVRTAIASRRWRHRAR